VQSATRTSGSGARLPSESRQAPRYGKPSTEAMTTESEGSLTCRQPLEMPLRLGRCPNEVEPEDQRKGGEGHHAISALARDAAKHTPGHEERDERRSEDAHRIPEAAERRATLPAVEPPVPQALASERRDP